MIELNTQKPQTVGTETQNSLQQVDFDSQPISTPLPSAKRFYHPELDALRAIAFFMVFLCHATPGEAKVYIAHGIPAQAARYLTALSLSFGFGLSLFFFLSAFLITKLLLLEIRNEGRLDIRAFYIRRILRIWPLFYTAMVIGGLFAWKHPHQIDAYGFILPYSAFVSNWFLMHNPWPDNPVAPLWSISLEEQFYLVLPLAIALAKPKMTRSIGCILITVSLLSLYVQGQHLEAGRVIWCNGLSQTIFFGLGVLLATLPLEQMPPPKKSLRIASFILAFVLFFISAAECYTNFPGNAHSGILIMLGFILAAVSCLLMLYSVWDTASVMPKSLIFLGKISFGLYVFHEIAMETMAWHILPFSHIPPLIRNFLSLPLDIAFAAASYAWLEKPFLRLRTRFTHVANRPL